MAPNLCQEDDYIDMEITSKPTDFEFFSFDDTQFTSPSPADELFYNGKLLPLHLPPPRQMVEHLLCTTTAAADRYFSLPFRTCSTTPSDSCNISPSESCRPSCDLNPNDNFFELASLIKNHDPKNSNSWPKKLKQKQSKLKSYLRSLFSKSLCSDESSKADANKYLKIGKRIADIIKNGSDESGNRRSFSGAIKRPSPTSSSSSSSSSSSFNSSRVRVNFLRRSSSANEIEGSIDAAIAHCKKSMETSSLSHSKIEEIGIRKFES